MAPRFYFSISQSGAEKAVREEILTAFPRLRSAFSRPGFITFREDPLPEGAPDHPILDPASIFCRLWGVSLGQARNREQAQALWASLPEGAVVRAFDRETVIPGDEPEGFVRNSRVQALLGEWGIPLSSRTPKAGERVYDWIWIDEAVLFLGFHVHRKGPDAGPGHHPGIPLPDTAPSRAYLKLEEAIQRFEPGYRPGMPVLEVGCSPGGATHAMLNRELRVTGIDPKRMDPRIEQHRLYRHIQKTARTVDARDLGGLNPEWLVLDMNLAPLEALDEVAHLLRLLRAKQGAALALRAGFLTIKLNDWTFTAQIPLYLRRIRELGFEDPVPVQLCANRQEFFVYSPRFNIRG